MILCVARVRVRSFGLGLPLIVSLRFSTLVEALLLLPPSFLLHLLPFRFLSLEFLLKVTLVLRFVLLLSLAEAAILLLFPFFLHLFGPLGLVLVGFLFLCLFWLVPSPLSICTIRACIFIDDLSKLVILLFLGLITQYFVSSCNSLKFFFVSFFYCI